MKLLVSDYDGTINFHGKINKEDYISLQRFYEEGNILMISSSRSFLSLYSEMLKYNIPFSLLCCNNGNAIFKDNKLIDVNNLTKKELLDMYDIFTSFPTNSKFIKYEAFGNIVIDNPLYVKTILSQETAFESYNEQFIEKSLATDYYLNEGIIFSNRRQKDYAVRTVMRNYNIDKQNVYTIGDGDNDYEMLEGYNGYTFPWQSSKVKQLKLPVVNSVSELINNLKY